MRGICAHIFIYIVRRIGYFVTSVFVSEECSSLCVSHVRSLPLITLDTSSRSDVTDNNERCELQARILSPTQTGRSIRTEKKDAAELSSASRAHSHPRNSEKSQRHHFGADKFAGASLSSRSALLSNDRLRSFRAITHHRLASIPLVALSRVLFLPRSRRLLSSRRSYRMSALHGAGSDPTATVRKTR